jgi:hypothetical protein
MSEEVSNYILFSALVGGAFLLILPGYIAQKRKHPYQWIIWALALTSPVFFGVTWLISLIWVLWPRDKNLLDPVVQGLSGNERTTGDTISEFASRYKSNKDKSVQEKLTELDQMLENNLITSDEYQELRKKALGI